MVAITATEAATDGPLAAETTAGAASCPLRRQAWIWPARASIRRCRPAATQRAGDPGLRQRLALLRGRGDPQHLQRVAMVQVVERLQRGRVELPKARPQLVRLPTAVQTIDWCALAKISTACT
jgi:hypothetical protein